MPKYRKQKRGKGWRNYDAKQPTRHSRAVRYGHAGGKYANMSYKQLKSGGVNLKPTTDSDHDGVPNSLDCRPLNKNMQHAPKTSEILGNDIWTEKDVLLIKRRMTHGKLKHIDLPADGVRLTPEQTKKGLDWLMNEWKTPGGKERKNNPFGYREQRALETFKEFRLVDYHDASNYYQDQMGMHYYAPIYRVVGTDGSFDYYLWAGKINIIG